MLQKRSVENMSEEKENIELNPSIPDAPTPPNSPIEYDVNSFEEREKLRRTVEEVIKQL